MPPRFHVLISTQFASALADNALLLVTIALMQRMGEPGWWVPLLKVFFIGAYVLLAPLLGPLADAWPKARLMAAMNVLKLVGAIALCAGLHPLQAFLVVGIGAAAYAPAKYGLVTELVPPQLLVRANAWIESSVVAAVLAGTVLGGFLVGPEFSRIAADSVLNSASRVLVIDRGTGLGPALLCVIGCYALASLLNLGVPHSGAIYERRSIRPRALWRDFLSANRILWLDRDGGLSLAVTVLCWATGAVLQFVVLRWAVDVLGLGLDGAAYLQAVVAVGTVTGAVMAGRWLNLSAIRRLLPLGVLLGLLVFAGTWVRTPAGAWPLLAAVGLLGGLLIVPMNALLQHRGHVLLTAGRSIAVQGFNENAGILVMLAAYSALLWFGLSIVPILAGLGLFLALSMGLFIRARDRRV